jgi:SAM-dependent methyltransferase
MKNILEHVVKRVFRFTYGRDPLGDGPRIRKKFSYFTPEDYYQASIVACLKKNDKWLDIGCGRDIFPNNPRLTKVLTSRAKETVGVDPSPNVLENKFLDRAYLGYADSVREENYYDLVTLRMVAEHVANPAELIDQIDRVSANGAHVIIYTIYKWSPVSIITKLTPFWAHHAPKRFFWNTEERDTFPVEYKMNTKSDLDELFFRKNFENTCFLYLDDCRTLAKYKVTLHMELIFRKFLNFFKLHYPELCILSIYRKKND